MYIGDLAKQTPHKAAYIMAGSGETVTYQQLNERSCQTAQLFRSLGLQTGDHIALLMEIMLGFSKFAWQLHDPACFIPLLVLG